MKFLLTRGEWTGTFDQLKALAETWRSAIDKRSLGQLAKAWQERHSNNSGKSRVDEPPPSGGIAFRVDFPMEQQQREQFASRLKDVVDARNQMAHHFLEQFNLTTLDDCRRALADLKQKGTTINSLRKETDVLANAMRDSVKVVFAKLETELKQKPNSLR
jgi:hypothetical protein